MESSSNNSDGNTSRPGSPQPVEVGAKRKEPEPESDENEEGQRPATKKVMTIYDFFVPYAYGAHAMEQSDRFECYEFQQMTACSKYNWFQR